MFLTVSDAAAQGPGPTRDLEGCRNGQFGLGPCGPSDSSLGWTTGNVGGANSLYRMGDFVPTRLVLRRLLPGREYTVRIGYTALRGGLHGYDYLGSYNASLRPRGLLESVTPCDGISETAGDHSCTSGAGADTQPIPEDTHTTFPNGTHPPRGPHVFSLWGATFSGAGAYSYACATCGTIGPGTTGDRERQLDITFTTPSGSCPGGPPVDDSCTIILAWGGHVASSDDWGFGRTYAELGGGAAGFHMKTIHARLDDTEYSLGGADATLSVSATGRPYTFTTQVSATEVVVQGPGGPGEQVTDRATLFGHPSGPVRRPTGHVHFFVCGPTGTATPCLTGTRVGPVGGEELEEVGTRNGGATSAPFVPTAPGTYCFRVVYEPNETAYYSPRQHTATTNECFVAVAARIRVTKLCDLPSDPGLFNILLNGAVLGEPDVACGGSRPATGYFNTTAAPHTVGEAAGTGTSLTDYTTTIGGDCEADGSITLQLGSVAVCEITNTRNVPPPPLPASLTLTKVCDPTGDTGVFELRIDGDPVADLRCGQSTTAPVEVASGVHTVTEVGVSGTNITEYTTTFGPTCPGGSITLAPAQVATCVITNTRTPGTTEPPGVTTPTTLRVDKVCVPANARGRFNLTINGAIAGTGGNVGCSGTTGVVPVTAGAHTVGETGAGGTALARYRVVIGGDCAANGTITVGIGQEATCLITNVLRAVLKPPPPLLCPTLNVLGRRMVNAGTNVRVLAKVHVAGRPLEAVHVFAVGPGVSAVQRTGATGHAVFFLNLRRPGVLTLRILRGFGCPKPHPGRIGILGVSQPSLTG